MRSTDWNRALAGLGLLDEALALDLRRPQDYFHRVWTTAFRATDLAEASSADDNDASRHRRRAGSPRLMSEPAAPSARTAAALAARRRDTQVALERVRDAITGLHRDKAQISVAAVARRANVSRTFLYTNPEAKTAIAEAIQKSGQQRSRLITEADDTREASWRERALNAEDALKAAHTEIGVQRTRIGELLGRIRDLEAECTPDDVRGSAPKTPRSNSVSASSAPTTAPSTNDSKPPAPTCVSKTAASPTWKHG